MQGQKYLEGMIFEPTRLPPKGPNLTPRKCTWRIQALYFRVKVVPGTGNFVSLCLSTLEDLSAQVWQKAGNLCFYQAYLLTLVQEACDPHFGTLC